MYTFTKSFILAQGWQVLMYWPTRVSIIDLNGNDDLFICGGWMPVRGFRNDGGRLFEVTEN